MKRRREIKRYAILLRPAISTGISALCGARILAILHVPEDCHIGLNAMYLGEMGLADEYSAQIKLTMRAIKHTLTERWYAWENARQEAVNDPEVDLSGRGPAFTPVVEVRIDNVFDESRADGQHKDVFENGVEEGSDETAAAEVKQEVKTAAKNKARRQRQGGVGSGAQTE